MNEREASLIVRLAGTAYDEGQLPDEPGDHEILEQAILVAGLDPQAVIWSAVSEAQTRQLTIEWLRSKGIEL